MDTKLVTYMVKTGYVDMLVTDSLLFVLIPAIMP